MNARNREPVAWLFPGQGAQHKGMGGRDLFDEFAPFVAKADAILGYSIEQLCLEDPGQQLTRTAFTQPALFVVNALSAYRALRQGPRPDYLAGHSLGEFNALHAAGCFDFETGLRLVVERSRLMSEVDGGAMAAVIGLDRDALREELGRAGCSNSLEIANFNSPTQLVVSGEPTGVSAFAAHARQTKLARVIPLAVSAAFHSRQMKPVAARFAQVLMATPMSALHTPVVANLSGDVYPPDDVRPILARQLESSVRWWDGLMTLRGLGVARAMQIGPGKAMANLWDEAAKVEPPVRVFATAAAPAPTLDAAPAAAKSVAQFAAPADASPVALPAAVFAPRANRIGQAFCERHQVRLPYVIGSMFRGIASVEMVVRAGRAGLLGFFGAGGLPLDEVERAILAIRAQLGPDAPFGMNLLASPGQPELEQQTVDLYLKHDITRIEASAFMQIGAPLIEYRFRGATLSNGRAYAPNQVFAKVSRNEVARAFLAAPADALLLRLRDEGRLSAAEVEAARRLPVATELCVEADSGGHTDAGVALTLLPAMVRLRNECAARAPLDALTGIGAAGGLGTPESIAAAFVMGAQFVLVGSVNQCSPEAGTSETVKDMLADLGLHDTAYAPAGDLFITGARVQVVRRGTLFPARANQLYQAYRTHDSLAQLPARTRDTFERFMGRSFDAIWQSTCERLAGTRAGELARLESDQKARMARVFKWYFSRSIEAAMDGTETERANFQIHSGPAMGAFNTFARGGELEHRSRRHVDAIADELMARAQQQLAGQAWTR
ncbi:ACP S-malonyltransferase [Paraburkholderia jirisanensis]